MNNILFLSAVLLVTLTARSQSNDPYAVFGHTSKVSYENKVKDFLYIKNADPCSDIKAVYLDGGAHIACLLGDNDSILKCFDMPINEQFTWISVDPKADKYPGLSPYNYVGNNPLNAIDPDGRYILPLNSGAKQMMKESKQQYGDLLTMNYDKNSGTYYTGANFKNINALKARCSDMKLNMSSAEINDAWSLYSGLASNDVFEVQTTTTQTEQGDYVYSFDQGGGTFVEGGGSQTNNPEFDKLMGIIRQGGLDENTAKALYDPKSNVKTNAVSPDAKGKGWSFFLNDSYDKRINPVKGQIMLDRTNKSSDQVYKSFCNALNGLIE